MGVPQGHLSMKKKILQMETKMFLPHSKVCATNKSNPEKCGEQIDHQYSLNHLNFFSGLQEIFVKEYRKNKEKIRFLEELFFDGVYRYPDFRMNWIL